ncbi:MAG: efflux RND transporter periplasmic adaptor subunit [Planctomycetaceae bacterium]
METMLRTKLLRRVQCALLTMVVLPLGCAPELETAKATPVPEVTVAAPQSLEIRDYEYFTGRIEATSEVEIRARVRGHLMKLNFQPGTEIAEGAVLAEVDARPYQAELDKTKAQVGEAQARLSRLEGTFQRMSAAREKGAVSEEDFQKSLGEKNEAAAAVELAKAAESLAQLNLDYCLVKSPIAGRVGDRLVDEGNLINDGLQGATLLTKVVAVDPVQVAFDMDENTLQKLQQAVRDGKLKSQEELAVPLEVGLPIHNGQYPVPGILRFVDNQIDSKTGTIRLKAECANPKPETGGRLLTPGMFVRVRIPIGDARTAMIIPESALGSDQGTRYLFVVGDDNKAVRLNAQVGLQLGELREVLSVQIPGKAESRSLQTSDRIIIRGLQRVRSGAEVTIPQ